MDADSSGARRLLAKARAAVRAAVAPWFGLTAPEQRALLVTMAIFALGLLVRAWLRS